MALPLTVSKERVLCAEILAVITQMRRNSRWAGSQAYSVRDNALATSLGLRRSEYSLDANKNGVKRDVDLMTGFLDLERDVRDAEDLDQMHLTVLFAPFFALIRSPLSTGPITAASLTALHNLFEAGFVTPESKDVELALAELSNTVSHCKFEASDASGDEVVLLKIMTVIKDCVCSPVGTLIGDYEVCEMLETVLTTCCQMRLSEILRRAAESTMHSLVRQIFYRLHSLDPETEERKIQKSEDTEEEREVKMSMQGLQNGVTKAEPVTDGGDGSTTASPVEVTTPPPPEAQTPVEAPAEKLLSPVSPVSAGPRAEYGLPSIIELLRVLINILDPHDRLHTDSTRLIALGVLNAAFEVAGFRTGQFQSLATLIRDVGCKYLFQLARSDNPSVLYLALRVTSAMFETMGSQLKLQQELFLIFTIDRLAPTVATKSQISHMARRSYTGSSRPSTPLSAVPPPAEDEEKDSVGPVRPSIQPARGESRALMLENLGQIARHPSFMVDLFMNYDCDVNCEDLFEKLVDFLAKGVYPIPTNNDREAQQQAAQLLCLDLLLEFIKHMATRATGNVAAWPESDRTPDSILQAKSRKRVVLTGASKFNTKPKVGLAFLEENGIVYSDVSADISRSKSLALFLRSCTRLDKRILGDYLSRPENEEVLKAFVGLFDFKNKVASEAMRELLESFRLPGEAQQIDRVTSAFAQAYSAANPSDFNSQDAVYVLAYSIIMLNTDLHNPQNRKRMTLEDYQRNLRGVNDKSDFPAEYLKGIYDSIKKREIVMPEEHTGQVGFEYAWKELLARSRLAGSFVTCNTQAFDEAMFKIVWKSVISAIAYAFTNFDDDYVVQRAIAGFQQCATLAGHFNLPDVFDYVVVSLSQVTGLLPESPTSKVPPYPKVDVDSQDVTISNLSVDFGTNFKGQLAAVVLFTIVNGKGNAIREGWTQIFETFENLFLHSLLPPKMLQMEDFLSGSSTILLQGSQPTPRNNGREGGGLLSALSSYLMTPYGSASEAPIPEATDAEIEKTLCSIDCLAVCKLDELYSQISGLEPEALIAAMRALEALAHERTVARLKQESDDPPHSPRPGQKQTVHTLSYDPAAVYLLETMTSIILRTPQHVEELWPIFFEHVSSLLSSATSYSEILIERAVGALLRLCQILAAKPSLRDQLYVSLDLLGSLPPILVHAVGEQMVAGVTLLLKEHRTVISSQTEWNLLFALLRNASATHTESSRQAFELILSLCNDGPEQCLVPDNLNGTVALLDDYATSAGTLVEKLRQSRSRGPQPQQEAILERGRKAVEVLFSLKKYAFELTETSQQPRLQAWKHFVLPIISSLARQSTNASRELRHNSLIQLQRILLGPQIISDDDREAQIDAIFNRVVFPLVDELLKPQTFHRDPQGMPETRLRSSALLCKVFMHYEIQDASKQSDIRVLWIQILDLLDRLMNIDRRDQLYEAIPESLKNVVLVMNASELLVPPPTGDDTRTERQRALWDATHERIERFLPKFLDDVIPSLPMEHTQAPSTPLAESQPGSVPSSVPPTPNVPS